MLEADAGADLEARAAALRARRARSPGASRVDEAVAHDEAAIELDQARGAVAHLERLGEAELDRPGLATSFCGRAPRRRSARSSLRSADIGRLLHRGDDLFDLASASSRDTSAATGLRARPPRTAGNRRRRSRDRHAPAAGAPGSDSAARSDAVGLRAPLRDRRGRRPGRRRRDRRGGDRAASTGAWTRRDAASSASYWRRVVAAGLGPGFEMAQLHAQDRALDAVHAVVEALEHVVVALLLAPVAQHAHGLGVLVIVGDDDAALAAGAEVLARIEAESSRTRRCCRRGGPCTRRRAPGRHPR